MREPRISQSGSAVLDAWEGSASDDVSDREGRALLANGGY